MNRNQGKTVALKSLRLENFKGLREFEISDFGQGVSIFGDNATGKTTIFDAFCWLLFGKDSLNSAAFEIKELDGSGNPVHGLNHSVEASISVNDDETTFKKVYSEKYTKRRGEAKKTFTGHTTDHYVNGVPIQQKDYIRKVKAVCDEDIFRLLTNPRHFNEVLHWTDRRSLLLEVCGDITDANVIATDESLAGLPAILGKRDIADHKKVIASRKAEINRELAAIPVRIDETEKKMVEPDIYNDKMRKDIQVTKKDLTRQKADLEKDLAKIESGGGIQDREAKAAELQTAIHIRQNDLFSKSAKLQAAQNKLQQEAQKRAYESGAEVTKAVDAQTRLINQQNPLKSYIANLEKENEGYRKQWTKEFEAKMEDPKVERQCPTCGQDLPAEKVLEAHERAEKAFNENKAETLESISLKGKANKKAIDENKQQLLNLVAEIKDFDKVISELQALHEDAVIAMDNMKADHDAINLSHKEDETLEKLKLEKLGLETEIENLRAGNMDKAFDVRKDIDELNRQIDQCTKDLLQIDHNERNRQRIEELSREERKLSAEFEKLESELYMIETFIRAKVALLEEKINSKFKLARFRLFRVNINEGLEEVCDTVFEGVPYNSMNNGARINIGLDICNTLSDFYNISMPCFIDNAEAVTALLSAAGQNIRLLVSGKDKKLRIEKM